MARRNYKKWIYVGDVDIRHGGVYINTETLDEGYTRVVRVTDMDSAAGEAHTLLVEKLVVYFNEATWKTARSVIGQEDNNTPTPFDQIEASLSYGYYDPDHDYVTPAWFFIYPIKTTRHEMVFTHGLADLDNDRITGKITFYLMEEESVWINSNREQPVRSYIKSLLR